MDPKKKHSVRLKWAKEFSQREFFHVLLSTCFGAIAAALLRLFFMDCTFEAFLVNKYLPPNKSFDNPTGYIPFGLIAISVAAVLCFSLLLSVARRGMRSWWFGVTSGLNLLPFSFTVLFLSLERYRIVQRMEADFVAIIVSFAIGIWLHCRAKIRNEHVFTEEEVQVSMKTKENVGSQISESDEPIQNWSEDTLGRSSLVDLLSVKLLISKAPVIALFGDFGSGKSSILNLLREHLADKAAIVISFSTWLPGSQETLISYLLSDIANECRKHYIVPGLRKSARRFANALSDSVPFLKGFSQLLPAATQKDDIENLRRALARLPKRVIVLLDELDRMEKEELLPLLKVVRGISALPNLSFVCAAERNTLTKTVRSDNSDESNLYFEKFFPSSLAVPKSDVASLQANGVERIIAALQRKSWFETDLEVEEFREKLTKLWPGHIAPYCRNLRAIGLLANDVGVAAAPLRREVDPIDLTLIELLRRFKPAVHEIVSRNSLALTGGESWLRGGFYHSSDRIKHLKKQLRDDLAKDAGPDEQLLLVKGILGEMFPEFAKEEQLSWELRSPNTDGKDTKNISDAGMFPAYFRYDLPAEMYGSVELEMLSKASEKAVTQEERKQLFLGEFHSMEMNSLKRDNFLSKIAETVKTVPIVVADAWTTAAVMAAKELSYDTLTAFGEAGHVIRMLIRTTLRLPKIERIQYLRDRIDDATDDTMAYRILDRLTIPQSDYNIEVSFADLYPTFISRMRRLYGRHVDAHTVDLTTSDPGSFNLWGSKDLSKRDVSPDPDDRVIAYEFWQRYIGGDRRRLLFVFDFFFLQDAIFDGPVDPWIENKLDVPTIKKLYKELPQLVEMSDADKKADRKLRRFLRGDFKNGIGIGQFDDDHDPTGQDSAA